MCKCLYCYRPLGVGETDFHPACAKKFFGTKEVPLLNYTMAEIDSLASRIIEEQTSLTGVQPKLSLHLGEYEGSKRLTIVGLWGGFIMKPQTENFRQLPEVEDLTMHLAEIARIDVVPHTLMSMADRSLCYLTKRIDRTSKDEKIPMEDFCQLTERQTEYKYRSSYEMIGEAIALYSSVPKLDVTNFMEVLLFSWIVGNNDMHLKNFSLYEPQEGMCRLTPAYDLLNVAIVNPKDKEELALTLNGKKSNIKAADFVRASATLCLPENVVDNLIGKYKALEERFIEQIGKSFLADDLKEMYVELIKNRLSRL
ncbi:MAG: HipA domain-containing protein [Muribaculaceae bacterium]|nr:HipA domain-containing protein [Muribaculaceae bacterium]